MDQILQGSSSIRCRLRVEMTYRITAAPVIAIESRPSGN